jgi:hypothetical protein
MARKTLQRELAAGLSAAGERFVVEAKADVAGKE